MSAAILHRLERVGSWLRSVEQAIPSVALDVREQAAAQLAELSDEAARLRSVLLAHRPEGLVAHVPAYTRPPVRPQPDPPLILSTGATVKP